MVRRSRKIPDIKFDTLEHNLMKYILKQIKNMNNEDKYRTLLKLGKLLNVEKARLIIKGLDWKKI